MNIRLKGMGLARGIFSVILILGFCFSVTSALAFASKERPRNERSRAAKFEIEFMTEMIDHHASALEMTELCEERAIHDDLKNLCAEMNQAQAEEISQMQAWLIEWYDIEYEPQIKPSDQEIINRLAALSDTDFEIAFMQEMIMHHRMAIIMTMRYYSKTFHEELQDMMLEIVVSQGAEIRQMQQWLCSWYSLCEMSTGMSDQKLP